MEGGVKQSYVLMALSPGTSYYYAIRSQDESGNWSGVSNIVSLGIPADRLRTVSYGKEFPFDSGHDDAAYAKNRRAHFVITAK
jgi:hypothetical protein